MKEQAKSLFALLLTVLIFIRLDMPVVIWLGILKNVPDVVKNAHPKSNAYKRY
jgi:hypothetical protein